MSSFIDLKAIEAGGNPNFQVEVGSVLGRTFRVWARNLIPFCLVGLAVDAPVLIALAMIAVARAHEPTIQRILELASNFFTLILTGAVTYGVFQELRGRRAGVGEVLGRGLSHLLPVFTTGLFMGLGMLLGFFALIIPGLVLLARWWVAIPVTVIEGLSGGSALTRSSDLTEGNRWRVFAVAIVVGLLEMVAAAVLGFGIGAVPGATVPAPASSDETQYSAWAQAVLMLGLMPLQVLAAVAPAIVYHDLRVGKEGADIEELVKVFE